MSSKPQFPIFTVTNVPKIVPVVLPPSADLSLSGRVRNIQVRGADHSGWLVWAGKLGWRLKEELKAEGYILLEDLYIAEGNDAGWEQYLRYVKDWQAGRTTKPFPAHLLPKEVQNRQRGEISSEYQDPWNLPSPVPTTGVVSDGVKGKKSKTPEPKAMED